MASTTSPRGESRPHASETIGLEVAGEIVDANGTEWTEGTQIGALLAGGASFCENLLQSHARHPFQTVPAARIGTLWHAKPLEQWSGISWKCDSGVP